MYALLCGELPFDEEDEAKLKEKIVKREYDLPEYLSSGTLSSFLPNARRKRPDNVYACKIRSTSVSGENPNAPFPQSTCIETTPHPRT